MASPHQEPDLELEKEQDDQFLRLPDDIVLLIINKLLVAETLIRLSLVSKRLFSLVFQSDSVFVDLDLCDDRPKFHGRLFGFFRSLAIRSSITNSNNRENLYPVNLQRFGQLKHLHVRFRLCVDSATKSLESDAFFRWQATFGSDIECFNLIIAESVNQSNPPPVAVNAGGINVTQGLNDELRKHALNFAENALKVASAVHDMIREHVLGHREMLESVVVSTDYGEVVMGKKQIARLRSSSNHFEGVNSDVVCDVGYSYVQTLHLLELGYAMKDVVFVANYIEKKFAVMDDANLDDVVVRYVSLLDNSERKKWEVFHEVVRLLIKTTK